MIADKVRSLKDIVSISDLIFLLTKLCRTNVFFEQIVIGASWIGFGSILTRIIVVLYADGRQVYYSSYRSTQRTPPPICQ